MGPLGWSGSHFLGLLVMIFYSPMNRDLYSPKKSSLKNSPRGPIGRVLSLPCIIPQRRVPFRNDPRGLIGLSALFTLYYPPKESSLEPLRGVPLFGDAFSYLIRKKKFSPPTTHSKTPYLLGGWLGGRIYLKKILCV